ncbi:hypothetical protein Bca52824_078000 [Brassica carinata]|uniref:F-box domain-containing protein n=1 Tax=Brassica carinata TaxID=52824 RepID=A0A8X7TZA3_BRACI|nr:hypothetical protein Bca52824_078000 [Brassica carinata]
MGSRDLISCLPREVLGEILSLLPTKLAASTSLLSKKWRCLFALVHSLDFDGTVLLQPPPEEGRDEIKESFRNFVDRTLALQCGCGSRIKKFSLTYLVTNNSDVVDERRWISSVVERGVLEVDVTLRPRWRGPVHTDEVHGNCFLPYHLFRSKTLVKLRLGTDTIVGKLPPDISDVLLPGCPMLEELTVVHKTDFYPNYRISSQTIKKLTVFYCYDFGIDDGSRISFDAPSVVSLNYADYALSEYPLVNLGSLVKAKLDISYSKTNIKRPDLSGLLVGISNVETLHLSPDSTDLISRCVKHGLVLPVFNNLVTLSFGSKTNGLDSYTGDVTIGLFQVKELHVVGYRGTAKELQHLKSLLAGTECIPKMQVEFPQDVVVDDAKMIQTRRDLFILVGVVSTDVAYFE